MTAPGETDAVIVNPLRAAGVIDEAGLERARAYQMQHGGSLSDVLLRLNLLRESEFLRVFAELYQTQFVKADKLKGLKINEDLLDQVGVRSSERLRMCAIRWEPEGAKLHVVAAAPLSANLEPELRQIVGARSVVVYVATPGVVNALIRKVYYQEHDAFSLVTANGAGPGLPLRLAGDEGQSPEREHTMTARLDDMTLTTLRKENARYRVAQEFHRRVSLLPSVEAMCEAIVGVLFDLLRIDGAALWLTTGQVFSKGKTGIELPREVIAQALASENGLLTSVNERGVQSAMAVRLQSNRDPSGVLYVESAQALGDDDLSLLEGIAAGAALMVNHAAVVSQAQQRVRLARFLNAEAIEEVLSGHWALKMNGVATEVTVLFADIRGFASLSTQLEPEALVGLLNQYFSVAVEIIEKHQGVVDKFIGDCVMGIWGAPQALEDDVSHALQAALELVERSSRILVSGVPLEIGVGLNTGMAVVGEVGAKNRCDFTAIGPTVTVAARLCKIAQAGQVLTTSETLLRAGVGALTEAHPPVSLTGLGTSIVPQVVKALVKPIKLTTPVQPLPLERAVQPALPPAGQPSRRT